MYLKELKVCYLLLWITILHDFCNACSFYSTKDYPQDSESGKFIRIKENHKVGDEILLLDVYPRKSISLRGMDRTADDKYFRIREINTTTIQIVLSKSLDDLVDNDVPQNILKFKLQCNTLVTNSNDMSFLTVTVYIEDINDNKPIFLNTPYAISIDESIPVGSIVFQGISAFDRDKPNTPNSDVQYFIGHQTSDLGGPYFMLDSPHRPNVILKRPLDYDEGLKQFDLVIIARDRGTPQQQSNTTLTIFIEDVDDLPPAFTHNVYHTKVKEFFTVTGKNIHKQLKIDPPVKALDQDSLNSTLIYSIISGNEKNNFWINPNDGMIFLKREIDLEEERLPENKYRLQLEVRQKNDHSKRASALLEIEIVDINDNLPEFEVDLYNISIVENLPNGFSVLQVNAIDRDQGENAEFLYKIHKEDPHGAFTVDPRTGWMTVKNQTLLDREERSSVKILIQAVEKVKQYDRKNGELSTVAVEITLLDANDNTPTFEMGNLYEFKVDVNSSIGHVIGQVKAFDPDEGPNGKIVYEIKNRKESSLVPFKLDRRTGVLTVNGHLHRGRIALFIEASDEPVNPSERRYSLAVLTLDIINKNDNGEIKFMGAPYEFWIGSNAPIGTSVGQVRTVYNSDVHDEIIYDLLHSYSEGVPFAIEEQSGIITVIRPINSFDRNRYNFEAVATYAHNPIEHVKNQTRQVRRKSSPEDLGFQVDEGVVSDLDLEHMYIANVTINVVNPNNKEKIFVKGTRNKLVEFHVKENQANAFIGSLLGKNVMDISKLNSTLSSSHPTSLKRRTKPRENRQMMNSSKFRKPADAKKNITNSMGGMEMPRILNRNAKMINYEMKNATRRMSIHEKYGRVYNLPPITLKQNISNLIKRNSNVAKYIRNRNRYQRAVPDGEINFIIANDHDVKDKIYISNEGNLMTASELDREENDFFKISVIAEYSHGPVATTGIYQINIIVDDENDNPPRFDHNSYVGIIAENSPLGTEVFLNNPIIARDADAGKNAEFTISIMGDGNRLFTIEKSDSTTNDVVKKQTFQNLNTTSLSMISDSVLDEYSSMIDKKLMNLHFMLMSSDDKVTTNQTNYVIKFVGPITLDRERKNFYRLRLVAKDSGGLTSEAQLMVFITDVNDNPPMFEKLAVFKNTGIEIIQYSDKMEIYFVDDNLEARTSEIETVFATALETTTQRNRRNVTRFNIREKFAEASNKAPVRIRYRKPIGTPRGYDDDEDDLFLSRNYKEGNFNEKYPIFAIEENVQPGITLLQFTATDEDYGNNAQITYEILEESVVPIKFTRQNLTGLQNFFSIDRISGELKINRQLIPQIEIKLIIVAKDNANLKDEVLIGIRVVDVNNNAPIFKRTFYSFDIEEGFHINKILGSIEATDDDYEDNANITYHVVSEGPEKFPFSVTSNTGIVKVSGDLDREVKGVYAFKIMAQDNSKNYPILNSTVEIEVNIIDKNDNIPQFIGFDELMINEIPTSENIGRKLSRVDKDDLHVEDEELVVQNRTPVYKIQINRHIRPRRFIKQIQAVDPDFAGNGNGLVMYGIKHSNVSFLFDIDAREGIVTTTSSWEQLQVMNDFDFINLTIVASDLGNPVKTSYALLLISLDGVRNTTTTSTTTTTTTTTTTERMTIPTKPPPVFYQHHQYYEIEVLENNQTPMKLLKLNTSNDYNLYRWSLVEEEDLPDDLFDIEDGTLWLKQALDREEREIYRLKVRADVISSLTLPMQRGRSAKKIQMMYPVNDDRISNLSENEVRVVIKVLDENDNTPTFKDNGQPIIAVLPSTASYGYNVYRVEATDLDAGINSEIRYSLINEVTNLFTIDSVTGQIRTIGNQIWRSNQRVFGLDILAKDRRGADDGKSSIVNMLVYVLDETKQVRFIMSGNAADIEKDIDRISESLSDASELIVRINMLEPNMEDMNAMTNLYIYAIDPKTNALVDMEDLQDIMSEINMENFKPSLPIVELAKFGSSSNYYPKVARPNESTAHSNGGELASIVLSITILVGGLATAVCLVCVRYKRMQLNNAIAPLNAQHINRQHLFHQQPPSSIDCDYSTTTTSASQSASPTDNMPSSLYAAVPKGIVKTRKNNLIHENREYIDVPLPQSVLAINMHQDHHESNCSRYNFLLHNNKSTKNNIIKEHYESNECICRDRLDEENSSVSYEDSLKDFPIEETTTTSKTTTMISLQPQQQGLQHIQHQRTSFRQKILNNLDRASNRHSFSGFHSIQRMKNSRRSSFVVNKTNPIGIIRQ